MATITRGKTFISGETVEPADMHQLVDSATITGIVNADIDANAAIAASKLALTGAITDTQLATGAVTGAAGGGKIAASAITAQTAIADPLADTDEFLVHDASASALRKVAYSDIAPTVTAAKLDGVVKDGSGNNLSAGSPPIFGCRAFVQYNSSSTTTIGGETRCAINASGNVTKVVKNSTGNCIVHFTIAMPDANYASASSCSPGDQGSVVSVTSQQTGSVQVLTYNNPGSTGAGSALDGTVSLAVFR